MKHSIALLILLLILSCGTDSEESPVGDAVPGVDRNHYLVSIDSIGIETGDSCYVFGDIWGRRVFPDGSIAILDRSSSKVLFFDPEGDFLREFSPVGGGPGEFQSIDRVDCDSQGNIMLASFYDRKMAWFNPDLSLLEEVVITSQIRGGPMRAFAAPDTGYVIITSFLQAPDSAGSEVALFRGSDEPETVYRRRMDLFDQFGNFQTTTGMIFTADHTGKVYISNMSYDDFNIVCYSAEGDSLFAIDMPYEPVRRSQEEIDAQREGALQNWIDATGSAEGFGWNPPEFYPSLVSIQVDGDGKVWVKDGFHPETYHVFDETGSFLYDCELVMPDWQETDDWSVNIGPYGIVASPRNPEQYPVVYMLEEVTEAAPMT